MPDLRPDAWFDWTRVEREEWAGQTLVKLSQGGCHIWLSERTLKELVEQLTPWPAPERDGRDDAG